MKKNKTRLVVEAFGGAGGEKRGATIIAGALGITNAAVYYWCATDKIPAESAIALYYYARRHSIPVSLEDLFHYMDLPAIHEASKESLIDRLWPMVKESAQ